MSRLRFTIRSLFVDTTIVASAAFMASLLPEWAWGVKLFWVVVAMAVVASARLATSPAATERVGIVAGLASGLTLAMPLASVSSESTFYDALFTAIPLSLLMVGFWIVVIRCVALVQRFLER